MLKKDGNDLNMDAIYELMDRYHLERIQPLYSMEDAEESLSYFAGYPYRHPVTIGKNIDADIVIPGLWSLLAGTPTATIGKQGADYFLDYVTGLIRPRVNGTPIKSPTKLNHHDLIKIGPLTMQLYRISQSV